MADMTKIRINAKLAVLKAQTDQLETDIAVQLQRVNAWLGEEA